MEHFLNFWNTIIEFLSNYGLHSLLGISIIGNIYLIVAWVRRERHLEMTEIEISLLKPRIKFELNKDEKYKFMANEIIRLKNEVEVLKKKTDKPWVIVIFMIIVAMIIGAITSVGSKSKKESDESEEENKEESSKEKPDEKVDKNEESNINKDLPPKDFLEKLEKEIKEQKIKKEDGR